MQDAVTVALEGGAQVAFFFGALAAGVSAAGGQRREAARFVLL
jgi:hypothetical protein